MRVCVCVCVCLRVRVCVSSFTQKMHPFAVVMIVLTIGAVTVAIAGILTDRKVEAQFEASLPPKVTAKVKVH